ncbi:MAG: alpha/beta hydrolase [Cyanobacteria bacterium P01_H01_bin.121]
MALLSSYQPPGFTQRRIPSALGEMAYYTNAGFETPADVSEQPTLIFLHSLGGGSSAYEWSKVYPAFADHYRVIAPDLVGWGSSAHPEWDYQIEDYLVMLQDLLRETQATHAIAIASSLTGGLVLKLASEKPDLFKGLFLVAPSGYSDFDQDYRKTFSAQLAGTPLLDKVLYQVGAANELAIYNFMQQFLFANRDRITREMVLAYLASAQQPNAEFAALASLKGNICFDLGPVAANLEVPTTLLWGEKAQFTRFAVGEKLVQQNPYAIKSLEQVPDSGVLPHLELPAVVINLLWRYLNQIC